MNENHPFIHHLNQYFRDPTLTGLSLYHDRIMDWIECFE